MSAVASITSLNDEKNGPRGVLRRNVSNRTCMSVQLLHAQIGLGEQVANQGHSLLHQREVASQQRRLGRHNLGFRDESHCDQGTGHGMAEA